MVISSIIDASSNLNPLGPSKLVIDKLAEVVSYCNFYPELSSFSLRKALSCKLNVEVDQVIIGSGSSELIDLIMRSFVLHGVVLVDRYGFFGFSRIANANHRFLREVSGDTPFNTSVDNFISSINNNDVLILLDNPSNPSGNFRCLSDIIKLAESISKNSILVIDEAYIDYYENHIELTSINLLSKFCNIIVLRTFSKIYGLAGVRVGYAVSSVEIIDKLNLLRGKFNVNLFAQHAALLSLKDESHLALSRDINCQFVSFMGDELSKTNISFSEASCGFISFILNSNAASKVEHCFLQNGIVVRNMTDIYDAGIVRVSMINPSNFPALRKIVTQFVHFL